ncbi:hypothetical protein PVA45_08135 (plasmid) [Entomospira entomophila]|uniref:Uncharacterized protein n=1 Tax=Entomospira entomophila TaxID=2719988 RepID=A0A968KS85_9SPIO|nr:hypothetical protein [Entomospira entomophilus]NIZ41474.1 hypothetical protein [Entomospira entomophilus]WDI36308.1 hypothetical protein PVA45_08135 [Entomospira entomophilus]
MSTGIFLLIAFIAVIAIVGGQIHQATSQNKEESGLPTRRRFILRQLASLAIFVVSALVLLYLRNRQ